MDLMGREDEFDRLIREYRLEDIREDILRFALPSMRLLATRDQMDKARSKLGGIPDLPPEFEWPCARDGSPLAFLCQFDLPELRGTFAEKELPQHGTLSFFFGAGDPFEHHVWGYDPAHGDRWKVFWFDGGTKLVRATMPDQIHERCLYASFSVSFQNEVTLSDWTRMQEDGLTISQEMRERYVDAFFDWDNHSDNHRLLGNPQLIQWDWRPECQLVTHGINCGTSKAYSSDEAKNILAERENWRLLLQLDSDEDGVRYWWGLGGSLYFAIRQEDLAERRFDRVWTILQTR